MNKNKLKIIIAIATCFLGTLSLFGCGDVVDQTALEDVSIVQEYKNEDVKVSDNSIGDIPEQLTVQEKANSDEEQQTDDNKNQQSPLPEKEETPQTQSGEDVQTQESETKPDADEEKGADVDEDTQCTLYVNCKSVLQNYDMLKENKKSVIPKNGVIYEEKNVSFSEGESVFDILKREMRSSNIHLEFVYTPVYNSVYIEGIGNLYEFDCGETSGWSYKVNGVKPNYGCSQYIVKSGDNIEFYYSCAF